MRSTVLGSDRYLRIRSDLLLRHWNVCCGASAMTANTRAIQSSGTFSWNRSPDRMTCRGLVQRRGLSSVVSLMGFAALQCSIRFPTSMAPRANGFDVFVVLRGVAEVVVIFMTPLPLGPYVTAIGAGQSIGSRDQPSLDEVVDPASGLIAVAVSGRDE